MNKTVQDKEVAEIEQAHNNKSFKKEFLNNKTWEMPVLAITHHCQNLGYLYVITSSGQDGSSQLMPTFEKVVNYLFP